MRLSLLVIGFVLSACTPAAPAVAPDEVPPVVIDTGRETEGAGAKPSNQAKADREAEIEAQRRELQGRIADEEGVLDVLEAGDADLDGWFGESATLGDLVGESFGAAGLGLRGPGTGGGGTGEESGLGSIGTIRHGSGFGRGRKTGGPPNLGGKLKPSAIQAVVRANVDKVKACYEAQLIKQPNLQGKITAKFAIASDGTVSTVSLPTRLHMDVDACVMGVVKQMKFPKHNSGTVSVSYPFIFKSK